MRTTLFLLAVAVALAGCGATIRPAVVWTVPGTMDDGEDCVSSNDTTPWPASLPRYLIVETRRVGTTTWTRALREPAVTGEMSPVIVVPAFGMWEVRGMVADSTGAGCWTDAGARLAMGWPSKAGAR
jgi:hypothetical protein